MIQLEALANICSEYCRQKALRPKPLSTLALSSGSVSMNMLEYLGHPISSLSSNGSALFLAGVANYLGKNSLQLWSCDPNTVRLDSKAVVGEITSTCMARTDLAAAATSDGSLTIFHIKNNCLDEVHVCSVSGESINCIDYNNPLGLLVMASDSGDMSVITPGQLAAGVRSHRVSKLPLTCVDASSANEVVLGTTAGHLKVMDLRNDKADVKTLSMSSASPITRVTRNPASPQFVVSVQSNIMFLSHSI